MKKIKIIELPRHCDPRGNLSIIEEFKNVPFKIERVYWIYDVPGGEARGGHAYKENQEFIVALSGSFDVILDDGIEKKKFSLNRSYYGLYVPKGLWREMDNFLPMHWHWCWLPLLIMLEIIFMIITNL